MSAAIFYHPEAYTISSPKLMGRNAAGESFLRGFIRYNKADQFWIYAQSLEHAQHFARTTQALSDHRPVRFVNKTNLSALKEPGVVFLPGPGLAEHAFKRSLLGASEWSLCGITHTTSSAGAMDAIAEILTAPIQPWDALICTSTAVKDNVTQLLQTQANYLQDRLGITKLVLPQLPVIPLGIHTNDFVFPKEKRQISRDNLGITDDAIAILFMGRLSFHAKAHPLAMYQALESAAKNTKKEIVLIECGWHANEFIKKAYADAAQLTCPSIRVITLDGRNPEQRNLAWASSDIMCSLSDNIQETFGIVPLEAMAAGLPVIVSDWDGYKDTVRHEIDGFRIPTLMPPSGLGADLAIRHALEIDTYDMYCGHTCSLVAVDIEATTKALETLILSPSMRHKMGQAGQKRVRSLYDWKVIIASYEKLWLQLAQLRQQFSSKNKDQKNTPIWPARMDPFHGFASYPTHKLSINTKFELADQTAHKAMERLDHYRQLKMVNFADEVLPNNEEIALMIKTIADDAQEASAIVREIPEMRKANALRALVWLAKLGIIKNASCEKRHENPLYSSEFSRSV